MKKIKIQRREMVVTKTVVEVEISGVVHSAEISEQTNTWIRDGLLLRNRGTKWFLTEVVKNYGSLTEENIIKYMDEKWIL